MRRHEWGQVVLRGGLVALFLWFGYSQVTDVAGWASWVPAWTSAMMPAETVVMLNGLFEIVLGLALAAGCMTRWVALLLALHLFAIAFEVGYNDIGVRDFALGVATLSLFFFEPDQYTLDRKLNRA